MHFNNMNYYKEEYLFRNSSTFLSVRIVHFSLAHYTLPLYETHELHFQLTIHYIPSEKNCLFNPFLNIHHQLNKILKYWSNRILMFENVCLHLTACLNAYTTALS